MIGVVILNYNNSKMTIQCYESIHKMNTLEARYYIVDNNSNDNSADKLNEYFHDIENAKVICSDINGGYSYGNNLGIKAAITDDAEYIAVLNNDVFFLNDALREMIVKFSDPEVAMVYPRTFNENHNDNQILLSIFTLRDIVMSKKPFKYFSNLLNDHLNKINYDVNEDLKFTGSAVGCCFVMPTKVWYEVDLLDENLKFYCEEMVLSKKLEERKLKSFYASKAHVTHLSGKSLSKNGNVFGSVYQNLGRYYYIKRYLKISGIKCYLYYYMIYGIFFVKSKLDSGNKDLYLLFFEKMKAIKDKKYD